MNFKLLLKAILILAVLALLVIMGMHNSQTCKLFLPPILPHKFDPLELPAAYMYFLFFGVGFLVGALVMTGGGRKGSSKAGKEK